MIETVTASFRSPEHSHHLDELQRLVYGHNKEFPGQRLEIIEVPPAGLEELGIDELPDGVAVIGGAARALIQRVAFGEQAPVRDVDLACIVDLSSDVANGELRWLEQRYMPDDLQYGHGIKAEAFSNYFTTRDLTINEVMIVNGVAVVSERGYDDLKQKRVTITPYESGRFYGHPRAKLQMKAQLLAAVFQVWYGTGEVTDPQPKLADVGPFFIALALNKALQYGSEVTAQFMQNIGEGNTDPIQFACELARDTDFEFRGSRQAESVYNSAYDFESWDDEDEWDDLPPYEGSMAVGVRLTKQFAHKLPKGVRADEEY